MAGLGGIPPFQPRKITAEMSVQTNNNPKPPVTTTGSNALPKPPVTTTGSNARPLPVNTGSNVPPPPVNMQQNYGKNVYKKNNKYFYKHERGNFEIKKNGILSTKWAATITPTNKILFNYSKNNATGKVFFKRINKKNNNSKNKEKMNAAPAAGENYTSMNVFKLLNKYKNARSKESREALEKAINSKLNQAVSNLKYKNTSYRITQYGVILRALHARPNFPGRSIIIGSIRDNIRRAAKSSNAKYEMERIRDNLKMGLLPIRDRNIRETFNKEFKIIKNRERRYENAYSGERRRNNGGGFFGGGAPPPRRYNNMGAVAPRYNMGAVAPRYNTGQAAPRYNMGPPQAVAQPVFNITGGAPPRINLPPVNIGTAAAPASNRTGALPVNLPANEASAIKQLGGVNAAANKINQAGGATNVAKTANALEKAGGNQNRAVTEFGADPKAIKLVIEVAGPTKNYNKVNNALNGLNKVATKIRRKRKTTPSKVRPKKKRVTAPAKKKRVTAPAKKKRVTAPAKKRVTGRVVRTGELNKLLHTVTKNTIERRMNNANLLNKVYTKENLAKIYKNFLLGKNLKK